MIKKIILFLAIFNFAFGIDFTKINSQVVDEANILSKESKTKLEQRLSDFEKKSSVQILVLTLKSLDGYDIAEYGYRLGRKLGIGQKGLNNGVILLVAPNEKKVRIEVGYGLEGALSDAVSGDIIRHVILPKFRTGDFDTGVQEGVEAMIKASEGEFSGQGQVAQSDEEADFIAPLLVIGFILLNFIGSFFKNKSLHRLSRAAFLGIFATLIATGFINSGIILITIFLAVSLLSFFTISSPKNGNFISNDDFFSNIPRGNFKNFENFGSFSSKSSRNSGFRGGGGSFGGGGASGSW
ncbi:YgcG family protein [Campylobacter sp. 19-13652]|uniref:TPM domain-containing protein n=1 Tax=Campylobacter sp. 19-13652 TaxID=2840180 RepID=UPI001C7525CE|nr:TPM domain-containing protein [Campylobacter sp. 19-13652]BCX80053.1 hypothetical protein LBC_15150 [Campylobacter sp. 19-13652]